MPKSDFLHTCLAETLTLSVEIDTEDDVPEWNEGNNLDSALLVRPRDSDCGGSLLRYFERSREKEFTT